MTEQEADAAFFELLREVGEFITVLSAEIGIESKAIAAEHPGLSTCDPRGRPLLMPRLMLLATFCEQPSAQTRPSRVVVSDWQRRYLAIDEITPNATAARTAVMNESARRLFVITFAALAERLPPGSA